MSEKETGTGLQKWGSYDLDTAAEEQEAITKDSNRAGFMKLKEGKNIVRILPPAHGQKSPFLVIYQHYCDTPDGGRYSFACPRIMAKRYCPVCEDIARLARTGSRTDEKRARELEASRRVFCAVIDRSDEAAGPKILGFGKGIHQDLVALRRDEDVGGDYTHPIKGIDVIIERRGTGKLDTKYEVNLHRRQRPIVEDVKLMDEIRCSLPGMLSRLARIPDEDEIRARLNGEDPPERNAGGARGRQTRAQDTAFGDENAIDAEFEELSDKDGWGLSD